MQRRSGDPINLLQKHEGSDNKLISTDYGHTLYILYPSFLCVRIHDSVLLGIRCFLRLTHGEPVHGRNLVPGSLQYTRTKDSLFSFVYTLVSLARGRKEPGGVMRRRPSLARGILPSFLVSFLLFLRSSRRSLEASTRKRGRSTTSPCAITSSIVESHTSSSCSTRTGQL